jgi:hypothetical protein
LPWTLVGPLVIAAVVLREVTLVLVFWGYAVSFAARAVLSRFATRRRYLDERLRR